MTSTTTSTVVTKQQKKQKKQTEYHLFIYKDTKNKSYVWVYDKKGTLSDQQLIDIANKYFKVKKDDLEAILMYRQGKNLFVDPVYGSNLITVITKKK